jgi:predicted SprT family Zn-dependent metalloprotease
MDRRQQSFEPTTRRKPQRKYAPRANGTKKAIKQRLTPAPVADTAKPAPTVVVAESFYGAYHWFNAALFGGKLPDCLITMQRQRNTRGYFSQDRFGHRQDATRVLHEIALNPATFAERSDAEIISTLVHEMTHLWQFHFGTPGRGRYHNKEWADKMEQLGLMPTHTGEPGGKRTGDRVTHYIIVGGAYDTEWQKLVTSGYVLDYQDRYRDAGPQPGKVKHKYTCEGCKAHVWGKPGLNILCVDCHMPMR